MKSRQHRRAAVPIQRSRIVAIFINKLIKSLHVNYAKAPFYNTVINELTVTLKNSLGRNRLVELNCDIISWMTVKLGVKTPMIKASTLCAEGERGERVASICEIVGADRYLSPAGAEQYLIEDKISFDNRNIEILIHIYEHPKYDQRFSPFIPYASALDLIFNLGPSSGDVMRSGRRPARLITDNSIYSSEVSWNEN